jgi:hypothetical protein
MNCMIELLIFYFKFVQIIQPLKYNNNKLKKQLIFWLNNKFISAAKAYLNLLYTKLITKLYTLDKRFKS